MLSACQLRRYKRRIEHALASHTPRDSAMINVVLKANKMISRYGAENGSSFQHNVDSIYDHLTLNRKRVVRDLDTARPVSGPSGNSRFKLMLRLTTTTCVGMEALNYSIIYNKFHVTLAVNGQVTVSVVLLHLQSSDFFKALRPLNYRPLSSHQRHLCATVEVAHMEYGLQQSYNHMHVSSGHSSSPVASWPAL